MAHVPGTNVFFCPKSACFMVPQAGQEPGNLAHCPVVGICFFSLPHALLWTTSYPKIMWFVKLSECAACSGDGIMTHTQSTTGPVP